MTPALPEARIGPGRGHPLIGKLKYWRRDLPAFLFGAQAFLAYAVLESGDTDIWRVALGAGFFLNLVGWLHLWGIARAVNDTPTSRVASAAQGYVELHGMAQPHQGQQVLTPHLGLPCLWYRYTREQRSDNKWRVTHRDESTAPFDLDDGSGRCTLDLEGAHIESSHQETRTEGDVRHTEWLILKGDALYALGLFASDRPEDRVLNARVDEGNLLAEWKADPTELPRRFDLDQDGRISDREWQLARQAARREIARRHQAIRAETVRHGMGHPGDKRPYLISNRDPESVGGWYVFAARLAFVLMLGCLGGLTWLLRSGG